MRRAILAAAAILLMAGSGFAQAVDPLAEARRLYNTGQYEAAENYARAALSLDPLANSARVVLGRIQLERFRQSANPADLVSARESLRAVDPAPLDYRERLELTVGQAEVLFLDTRFGGSAELFESSLDRSVVLGPAAHERVLDWWATALDRYAQSRPVEDRPAVYARITERMRSEVSLDPGSTPASYWLAAAARGAGDVERAWHAALAGWVRGALTLDRGAALRADLDQLVTQAIVPERVMKAQARDAVQAQSAMLSEWDAFKAGWSK